MQMREDVSKIQGSSPELSCYRKNLAVACVAMDPYQVAADCARPAGGGVEHMPMFGTQNAGWSEAVLWMGVIPPPEGGAATGQHVKGVWIPHSVLLVRKWLLRTLRLDCD